MKTINFKKYFTWWEKLTGHYLNRVYINEKDNNESELPQVRNKLFISILLVALIFGFISYIPSIIISVQSNELVIGIFDTLAIAMLIYISFSGKLNINTKKTLFSITVYALSVILFIYLGTKGPATIIFLSLSILITLFYSRRAGLIAVALNAAVYFTLPFFLDGKILNQPFFKDISPGAWMVIGFNLVVFNLILVLSVSFLIDYLQKSLEQKKQIAREWEKTFHAIDTPIFLIGADSQILRSNYSAKKFYGNNSQMEFNGKCHDIICNNSVAEEDCPFFVSRKSLKGESKVFFRDNKWIEEIVDPYWDENNKFTGAVLVCRDITESKQAEILLRKEEAKFRSVSETATDAIIIGDSDGKIIFWNESAQKIFGYSEEEALNKPITVIIPPDLQKDDSGLLKNIFDPKQPMTIDKTVEMEGLTKNGDKIPLEIAISHWETNNEFFFSVIIRDITEKKTTIDSLIAAKEKAEEMNKVKSFFFANMSHELRTPFVGIMGYAELLAEVLENEEHKEMANGIIYASKRMLDTLNNILVLTKIEFDGLTVKYETVDVNEEILSLIKEYKPLAELKKLELTHNIRTGQEPIITDKQLFQGILSNLISNALKYTEKGRVEVCADIEKNNSAYFLIIKVIDTGIGIPEDKQDLIWQEFRQVSEGTTRSHQGSGLGLAITKKYVEKLGGNIRVESKVGKGSTFIVKLPIPNESELFDDSVNKNK